MTRVAVSEAQTIHQRPAPIQEMQWRPSYLMSGSTAPQNDPVQQIVFGFYNDQLFKLLINSRAAQEKSRLANKAAFRP